MRERCQLQLLDLYLEISVFVPLDPGSSGGSALLPGPGPGLVLVSKALHCAARPGPGCQQDHASTGCLHSASKYVGSRYVIHCINIYKKFIFGMYLTSKLLINRQTKRDRSRISIQNTK